MKRFFVAGCTFIQNINVRIQDYMVSQYFCDRLYLKLLTSDIYRESIFIQLQLPITLFFTIININCFFSIIFVI